MKSLSRAERLYELRAGDVGWSTPYPESPLGSDFLGVRKAPLRDILEDIGTKTLAYLYDFGVRDDSPAEAYVIPRLANWGTSEVRKQVSIVADCDRYLVDVTPRRGDNLA
jgi:hypothetical protein